MDIGEFRGEDFQVMVKSDGWKIGFLRHSERFADFGVLERHLLTEESFILLAGSATLYENYEPHEMEPCKVYTIGRGVWHHIVVSEDATVMVVENADTSLSNTERIRVTAAPK